ncbi:type II toxin-antitoxin system death-on-curing family toxin [Aliiroseovarius sp. S1339]|uniref:type II toxin-antitoxin system death-on-curing family toxin n=1 Tax=Aliiroseovarius sp. S1339 TaxID=2936990 RepID=UPI0020BE61E7|nr:type II toxin-antitoxin system death-on-curing family toxin [Aliiroseovarius sp. S1339]MCK8465176.1 type II toxin-antitoxin system death-on-curing family toxin [Aliiroseovarius sp. S1339]
MMAPVWVPIQAVIIIHDRQISRHGGASGLRDFGLLEAGCARARNQYAYEQADVLQCAAAYAFGIAKAHAFVDGNKRTAFVTMATFLRLNGWHIRPDPAQGVLVMERLASDQLSEVEFRQWLERIAKPMNI